MTITLRERMSADGIRTVELESRDLIVTVLPDKGADICEIRYKPRDGVNVLYRSLSGVRKPGTVLHPGTSEEHWMDCYHGGWQTLFPNAGAECRYRNATHGFHGEASATGWAYLPEAGSAGDSDGTDRVSAKFATTLCRSPFRLEKTVTLEANEPVLRVRETVTNVGGSAAEFVWGQHLAFGAPFLSDKCRLQVPNDRMAVDPDVDGASSRLVPGAATGWPTAATASGETIDFGRIPGPESGTADMAYLTGLKEGWYALRNEELGFGVGVSWDPAVFPYIWLWQEFGGTKMYPFYGSAYVMGVEPCSVPHAYGLAEAARKGEAFSLLPGETKETEICVVLIPHADPVSGDPGKIRF